MQQSYNSDIVSYLARHLVVLSWQDEELLATTGDVSPRRTFAVSTFMLEWKNRCFLVTAGHILDQIDAMLATNRRMTTCQLWDGHAYGSKDQNRIPFDYNNSIRYSAVDTVGQDIGLIWLSPLYCNLLKANGIVPFPMSTWTRIPSDLNFHLMIGLPSQLQKPVDCTQDRPDLLESSIVLLNVRSPGDIPDCMTSDKPRFYGRLDANLTASDGIRLDDIDGMSGGPIIGFKRGDDGRLRYWLVGIQSSWERQTRTIAAAPVSVLEQMFLEAEAVLQKYEAG